MTIRPTLVLDLDGTLVDTASDLVATLNVVLASEDIPAVANDDARAMIGKGARAMLKTALTAAGHQPDKDHLDRLLARFLDHYADHLADTSQLFPGAEAALDRFDAAGWRLAICTNKFEIMSRSLLGQLGVADRFATIAGQDTFAFRKPDPRHLTETIALAGGDPRAAIMVGDSEVDIRTAQNAGIPVVAVTFGYTPRPVESFGPNRVIDHYDALFEAAVALLGREAPGGNSAATP